MHKLDAEVVISSLGGEKVEPHHKFVDQTYLMSVPRVCIDIHIYICIYSYFILLRSCICLYNVFVYPCYVLFYVSSYCIPCLIIMSSLSYHDLYIHI